MTLEFNDDRENYILKCENIVGISYGFIVRPQVTIYTADSKKIWKDYNTKEEAEKDFEKIHHKFFTTCINKKH